MRTLFAFLLALGSSVAAAADTRAPDAETLTGLIEAGPECLRLRLEDGRAVSLQPTPSSAAAFDRTQLLPGMSVRVVALPMRMSVCMAGPAYQVLSVAIVEPR